MQNGIISTPELPGNKEKFIESLNKYGITFILLESSVAKDLPLAGELSFKEVYRNPDYTIYKLVK